MAMKSTKKKKRIRSKKPVNKAIFDKGSLKSLYMRGNYAAFLDAAEQHEQAILFDYELASCLGAAFGFVGNTKRSISVFQHCARNWPGRHEPPFNLGLAFFELENYPQAKLHFQKALDLVTDPSADLHAGMADSLAAIGQLTDAVAHYRRSLVINPHNPRVLQSLLSCLITSNDFPGARAAYSSLKELGAATADLIVGLGMLATRLGLLGEARECFLQGISDFPGDTQSYLHLSDVAVDEGEQTEAIRHLTAALRLDTNNQYGNYALGKLLRKRRRFKEARTCFDKSPNYQHSREFGIESSYLLGDLDDYRKRVTAYCENDVFGHPLLGATELHHRLLTGTDLPTLFCRDPMTKIIQYHGVLSNQNDYRALKTYTSDKKTSYRGQNLLINGEQTYGDFFNDDHPFVNSLLSVIKSGLLQYREQFYSSEDPFIKNFPSPDNLAIKGWLIRLHKGGSLKFHNHDAGWVSGTIYFKLPEPRRNCEGDLKFSPGGGIFPEFQDKTLDKTLHLEEGSLVLFPSSLWHTTVPFEADDDRVCLAFDITPGDLTVLRK